MSSETSPAPTTEPAKGRPSDNRVAPPSMLRRYGSQMGIIGVGIAMWIAFIIVAPEVFLDWDIYKAFAETTPLFGVLALALTFVVITGEIDLSFPSIMALGTAMFCLTAQAGVAPRHLVNRSRSREAALGRCSPLNSRLVP